MKYEIQILPQNEVTTTNRDWEIAIVRANALHGQITGLTNQIQTLEQKRWMTAVVLGGLLARMKAAAQHGEWKALFAKNDTCVVFDQRTAQRYMKLYREVLKRARKLGTVDVALIESGRRDARTLEEIGKLSDADSLRQAYFDFGVVTPPKSHGTSTIDDNRGTGKPQPIADPEEALAARQKSACDEFARIMVDLEAMLDTGRLPLVNQDALAEGKDILNNALRIINALTNA
ncbi:DUF3102 domain-containing protein [Akkermansia muciniphila]|uniref:DUF3102 domain-containing protein n=1 Tax=Akkermansia muciniphila TaxID=239935 RepID=UPI000C9BF4FF|nr:DUF3102 domain-containing protein [Akkermansia muciniphila]PNC44122.1 hypothetical protein CXU08_04630 [Akkermansia muciniphila]PNC70824.1 hypothetical protein CXU04_08985 [Akkermansia muciniphila]